MSVVADTVTSQFIFVYAMINTTTNGQIERHQYMAEEHYIVF